mgnify:CR=1 FL=1
MNFNKLNTEVLCWNCLGWGHTKQRCPSSNIPRSIADAHHIFEQRLARDAQQHPEQARRRPLGRGSQRRPPTAMTTTEIDEDDKDWEDEDDQEETPTATSTAFSHDVTFSSTEDADLGLHPTSWNKRSRQRQCCHATPLCNFPYADAPLQGRPPLGDTHHTHDPEHESAHHT